MLIAKLKGNNPPLKAKLNQTNINISKDKQTKTIIPTKERQEVTADKGYELAKTIVEPIPDNFIEPTGVFEIEENGEYDITEYKTLVSNVPAREDLDAELNEQDALLNELDGKIDELPDREADLSEATATADDVFEGKVAFGQDGKIVGTYKDMLQRYVDVNKKISFSNFPDEDMSWVNKLDTSQMTTMNTMFLGCLNATVIDVSKFNTSNVTDMYEMFRDCKNIPAFYLSNFDTSNVTDMTGMFEDCEKLVTLDLSKFDLKNVKRLSYMFAYCSNLTTLDLSGVDTSKVEHTTMMFGMCQNLTTIIGTLDLFSVTNNGSMFFATSKLQNVNFKNIKKSIDLKYIKFTYDYLINIIKELWDLTDGTSQKLTLSTESKTNIANIYVKLIEATDEMRAEDPYIDNKKPCVVCESTDEGAMTLTEYAISKNWSIA